MLGLHLGLGLESLLGVADGEGLGLGFRVRVRIMLKCTVRL